MCGLDFVLGLWRRASKKRIERTAQGRLRKSGHRLPFMRKTLVRRMGTRTTAI